MLIAIAWLYFEPSFEPTITTVVSLSALLSTFFLAKENKDDSGQSQIVGNNSKAIQSGEDVNISLGKSNDKEN